MDLFISKFVSDFDECYSLYCVYYKKKKLMFLGFLCDAHFGRISCVCISNSCSCWHCKDVSTKCLPMGPRNERGAATSSSKDTNSFCGTCPSYFTNHHTLPNNLPSQPLTTIQLLRWGLSRISISWSSLPIPAHSSILPKYISICSIKY